MAKKVMAGYRSNYEGLFNYPVQSSDHGYDSSLISDILSTRLERRLVWENMTAQALTFGDITMGIAAVYNDGGDFVQDQAEGEGEDEGDCEDHDEEEESVGATADRNVCSFSSLCQSVIITEHALHGEDGSSHL
jgi:hypothetical protein